MVTGTRAAFLFALGFTGCGAANDGASDAPPRIKIGMLTAFTDRDESQAQTELFAVQLAINQVNSAGGLLDGREVVLVTGNDGYDPDKARSETRRLVEDENVVALLGPVGSSVTRASLEITVPRKIPSISCCASNDGLDQAYGQTERGRYFFRLSPPDRYQVPVLARTARECLGCKSLAVFHRNDDYGNPFAEALRKLYMEPGEKVAYSVAYDPAAASYQAEVEAADDTDADCGVLIGYSADATRLRRNWAEFADRDLKWVGSEGILADAFVMLLGDASLAEGLLVTTPVFDPPSLESSSFETFYRATSGKAPSPYNAQMYDSTALLLLAIAKAGSLDGDAIRDALFEVSRADPGDVLATPGKLSDALADLAEGKGINYQGASGAVDFGPFGNVAPQYDVYEYTPEGPYRRVGRVEEGKSMPCAPAATP